MTSSRRQIIDNLAREKEPFPGVTPPATYRHMVPLDPLSPDESRLLFINEAEKAACVVHQAISAPEAVEMVLQLVGDDEVISSWEPDQISLPGLQTALEQRGIARVGEDATVRVGLTGADAALAATGSLVLCSGPGCYRATSLLPPVHVAIVTGSQVMADLEQWLAQQRTAGLDKLRQSSNVVIVTGPSRTADIAMQLVMGMHGPREVHIILVDD